MNEQEIQEVLDELNEVRPEVLNNKTKRLFKAIMKIADDRDKANKRVDELINEVTIKQCELEKKDKIIDLMAKDIEDETTMENYCNREDCYADIYINGHCEKCLNCIKRYFTKQVEGEKDGRN